jgi:predicted amidohydrolase
MVESLKGADLSKFKVAGVQMDIALADAEANLTVMEKQCAAAASEGAQLVVFPECTLTGYCFESLAEAQSVAQPIDGSHVKRVVNIAKENNTHVVFGMLESGDDAEVFNSAVLVNGEGVVGVYRKTHLPFLGVDRFTTPGTRADQIFQIGDLSVGLNICYDCSFPESARVLALAGADIVVLPTNWPPGSGRVSDLIPNTRALENNIYFMSVNRIGTEKGFDFIGKSKICDPFGGDVQFANHANEAVLIAEIDTDWARKKHLVAVPGKHEVHRFKDRRPDIYGSVTK